MHSLGKLEAVVGAHNERYAALAGLGIDADHGLVNSSDIRGIDGKVRHLPDLRFSGLHRGNALVDGILVRTREGGEHELAGIGMALVDAHLGAFLADIDDLVDILEVQFGIDSLGEHVVSDGENVDVAGPLAVAEECSLNTLRARKKRQLRSRNAAASVIVRVDAENNAVSVLKVTAHPLDLVRVHIGRCHFHRGRQVEDHGILRSRLPYVLHCCADLQGKIQLRAGKALGGIFKIDLTGEFLSPLLDPLGSFYCYIDNGLSVLAEHHVPLKSGGGVVDMDYGLFAALDGLESLLDLILSALGENLNDDVVRDHVFLDQFPEKIILKLACRRESDLDLFKAELDQEFEHLHLLAYYHRIDQRLVAVPEIYADPCGRLFDLLVRPFSLRIIDDRRSPVPLIPFHNILPFLYS